MLDYQVRFDYLVGIDSDGCAFDTMELKQKECFTPNTVKHWGLQGISKYVREACDFVNLYSKSRGINRFPALVEALDWTARRPEVRARGVKIEVPQSLRDWIGTEKKLGNPALEKAVAEGGDPGLSKTLAWSKAINQAVEEMVHGVPPFPFVRRCLEKLRGKADVLVVSATPQEALDREWAEHDLTGLVGKICGQELGTKKEFLALSSKYPAGHALMIGDALGDYQAAQANRALFFPINPGDEEASWQRLFEEGIDRFFAGRFAGEYEAALLAEFDRRLPARPPWKVVE